MRVCPSRPPYIAVQVKLMGDLKSVIAIEVLDGGSIISGALGD